MSTTAHGYFPSGGRGVSIGVNTNRRGIFMQVWRKSRLIWLTVAFREQRRQLVQIWGHIWPPKLFGGCIYLGRHWKFITDLTSEAVSVSPDEKLKLSLQKLQLENFSKHVWRFSTPSCECTAKAEWSGHAQSIPRTIKKGISCRSHCSLYILISYM